MKLLNFFYLFSFFLVLFTTQTLLASKLVEVRPVDQDYVMIYLKDGEVIYTDDGQRASAYSGHDCVEGDEKLIAYGEELNVESVPNIQNWKISSPDDIQYKGTGLSPIDVYRKSKVTNTTHEWEYKLDHWLYLKLPKSMKQGYRYILEIDSEVNSDQSRIEFTFDVFSQLSEAVHVNMIGYRPESPVKSADLYLWLGDGGPRDYQPFEGNQVWLVNSETGKKYETGKVRFWKKSTKEAEDRNLTGSSVWIADFSEFKTPGSYKLVIDEVGCSREFEIKNDAFFEPYKFSVRGYYYMRIGEDQMEMVPVPRRPLFIPGKDPEGFTVYVTSVDPFDKIWHEHQGDTWDECHFKPAKESLFWKNRLPGNPTNPNAKGGHSDALDWDRHLAHVTNIYDLLLPYWLTHGKLDDDNLQIAESGNGIPDIIDEARNEVDFFLSLKFNGGYGHGLTNPTQERNIMFQADNTNMAAWANAANCAMIADCFRISGHKDLEAYYTQEALIAYDVAGKEKNSHLDVRQGVGDAFMLGRDFKMMAAAFLYNLTGDTKWEDIMAEECYVKNGSTAIEESRGRLQTWGLAAYLFTPQKRHYPELYDNIKSSVRNQAMKNNVKWMDIRPSRKSTNNAYWRTAHNLNMVVLAHALSADKKEKAKLEKCMILEVDWGLGRNPSNIVEMTGLGERHIVNCYTSGRNDGTPGLHPGHTPYNNLDPWGTQWRGSNPRWFTERGYPEWGKGWPEQESHFNCRYSWANGEFTPRQTMRGKMVLYGYLYALSK